MVVVLNVGVIMVYFFLRYPRLLLIKENKRKNCPLMQLDRLTWGIVSNFGQNNKLIGKDMTLYARNKPLK